VAQCLRAPALDKVPLLVAGGGTKLGWGNPGSAASWVRLETGRLGEPREVEPAEGVVRVGAGVTVDALEQTLESVGRTTRLPTDHPGSTVGGSVAADPPSARRTLDRCLRNDLLGLEVALPNGTLTRCGGRVVKNVTGFDLVRLYCGSLGTLGVITEVTLRLRPRPAARIYGLREVPDARTAMEDLRDLAARGDGPDAALLVPGARALRLLWLLEGSEADVSDRAQRISGERIPAEDWDAVARRGPAPGARSGVSVRIGTRGAELPCVWSAVEAWSSAGARLALPLLGVVRAEGEPEGLADLYAESARRGWSCFIEGAPVSTKRAFDAFGPATSALPLMRALKQRFDPEGVLAPGRFAGGL